MITFLVIAGLSGLLIAGLIKFWKEIVEWIKKAADKIKTTFGLVVKGTRTFIVKTLDGLRNRAKHYNENETTGEWEETVVHTNVDESDVSADILAKVRVQTIDIEIQTTEELRLAITA